MAKPISGPSVAGGSPASKPKRQARPQGPRTLYLILQNGTDPAAFRAQIQQATFNGRAVLNSIEGGATPAIVKLKVESGKRNSSGGEEESVEVEASSSVDPSELQSAAAE